MTHKERYQTPEELAKAFNAFCGQYCSCKDCPVSARDKIIAGRYSCVLYWLTLEAEEELLACPFCGENNIDIFETDFGRSEEPYQFAVECSSCGALVSAEERGVAIAKWNRRAK